MQWKELDSCKPSNFHNFSIHCLVKAGSPPTIFVLVYNVEKECWEYPESHLPYDESDYGKIHNWIELADLDRDLSCKADYWAWNFCDAFLEEAIPALTRFSTRGCSYPNDMNIDEWHSILSKIKDAFVETQDFFNGKYNKSNSEERRDKFNEIKEKRKEAFRLMGEYFEDMWD